MFFRLSIHPFPYTHFPIHVPYNDPYNDCQVFQSSPSSSLDQSEAAELARWENIARVQNCPDITIFLVFVFLPEVAVSDWRQSAAKNATGCQINMWSSAGHDDLDVPSPTFEPSMFVKITCWHEGDSLTIAFSYPFFDLCSIEMLIKRLFVAKTSIFKLLTSSDGVFTFSTICYGLLFMIRGVSWINKLASLKATLVQNYVPPTHQRGEL